MNQAATTVPQHVPEHARARGGNAVGIASFVFGALGAGLVAIVLGVWGLARYRSGRASRRSWPLAGLILGVISTAALGVLAYLYATSDADQVAADAHAQVDVITVGNVLVELSAAGPDLPQVELTVADDAYGVGGTSVEAALAGDRTLALDGVDAYDWCLTLTYEGGAQDAVAFHSATGLVESGECPAG
ncbi:hypothetical protein [Demequina pelophila]|uniref:hypothetical protein n=1 Tax=Demequina pelophila TaxID=1638984 RepID=UPI000784E20D|nr:hypothetical protein [Demequina pelophila]